MFHSPLSIGRRGNLLLSLFIFSMLLFAGCPQEEESPVQNVSEEEKYVAPEPEPILEPLVTRVGFIGPLTGENASMGQEALNALQLAASALSDELYAYEIIEQDGMCARDGASEAVEYLVDFRGVSAVIGGLCPGEVDGMAASLEERSVILISLSKGTIDNGQVMSFAPPSESASDALLDLCLGQSLRRLIIVTDGSSDALAKKSSLETASLGSGVSLLPSQVYSGDSSFASSMRTYHPEAVVIFAEDGETSAKIVNSLRSSGFSYSVVGGSALVSSEALSLMCNNSEGVYAVVSEPDYSSGGASHFLDDYSLFYGEPKDRGLVVNAADAFYLLAQAQDFYYYRATPQDLRNYWLSLDSWEGFGGTLFFEHGDRISPFRQVVVLGGSVESLP